MKLPNQNAKTSQEKKSPKDDGKIILVETNKGKEVVGAKRDDKNLTLKAFDSNAKETKCKNNGIDIKEQGDQGQMMGDEDTKSPQVLEIL